jgi:hypothetical protein
VYKAPTSAPTNGLQETGGSGDNAMTFTTDTVQTPAKYSVNGKEQKVIIDKLTFIIPFPGFTTPIQENLT